MHDACHTCPIIHAYVRHEILICAIWLIPNLCAVECACVLKGHWCRISVLLQIYVCKYSICINAYTCVYNSFLFDHIYSSTVNAKQQHITRWVPHTHAFTQTHKLTYTRLYALNIFGEYLGRRACGSAFHYPIHFRLGVWLRHFEPASAARTHTLWNKKLLDYRIIERTIVNLGAVAALTVLYTGTRTMSERNRSALPSTTWAHMKWTQSDTL